MHKAFEQAVSPGTTHTWATHLGGSWINHRPESEYFRHHQTHLVGEEVFPCTPVGGIVGLEKVDVQLDALAALDDKVKPLVVLPPWTQTHFMETETGRNKRHFTNIRRSCHSGWRCAPMGVASHVLVACVSRMC